jgi:hypothetical protein
LGKPATLLEGLCGHALSLDAHSIKVEHKDGHEWVFACIRGVDVQIARYKSTQLDAIELLQNLEAGSKRPIRTLLAGKAHILNVRVFDTFGESAYAVIINPLPKLDPSEAPKFTAKQGQYLACIYHYTKIHRQAPAETDMQRYFRVSPPSINGMMQTLQRNGLIERTPGQARSIRLLVNPELLPRLTGS